MYTYKVRSEEELADLILKTYYNNEFLWHNLEVEYQGMLFKFLDGKVIEERPNNVNVWQLTFMPVDGSFSLWIKCTTRYIKTRDELKLKSVDEVRFESI